MQRVNGKTSMPHWLAELAGYPVEGCHRRNVGRCFARAGMLDQARQVAELIKPLADPMNSEQMGYLHLLEGDIALATRQEQRSHRIADPVGQRKEKTPPRSPARPSPTLTSKAATWTKPLLHMRKCSAPPTAR